MKTLRLVKILTLISVIFFQAEAFAFKVGDQEVDVTLTDTIVTRYIWRGQDLYGDNDAAHQPSIDISFPGLLYGADLSFNVWGSFPLNSGHEDSEELDYSFTLSKDLLQNLNLSAGYTYFDYPNANKTSDVSEPWFSVTLNKVPVLPIDVSATLFAGYDFQAASGGPDEGWYYSWGFDTELPLPELAFIQDGQTLAVGVVNWGNDGVADLKPSSLYATEFSCSTSYAFGDLSITPSVYYTINHEESINADDEEFWGAVEASFAF